MRTLRAVFTGTTATLLLLLAVAGCGGGGGEEPATACEEALVDAAGGDSAAADAQSVVAKMAADPRCAGILIPGDVVYPSNQQHIEGLVGADMYDALSAVGTDEVDDVVGAPAPRSESRGGSCGAADILARVPAPFRSSSMVPQTAEEVQAERDRLETMSAALTDILADRDGRDIRDDAGVVLGAVEAELDDLDTGTADGSEMFGDDYFNAADAVADHLADLCGVEIRVDRSSD